MAVTLHKAAALGFAPNSQVKDITPLLSPQPITAVILLDLEQISLN